ncbi:MAG: flagellar protein FlaG [Gammaproteobacteria bacterium]|nr:flagellar protein FlaG [Gammaproteobacteria bacterium]MCF6230341.1 flagellar protein FlaG [Gammaproteobacteria bacterium]
MNIPTQLPLDPSKITTTPQPNQRVQSTEPNQASRPQETPPLSPLSEVKKADDRGDVKKESDALDDVVKNLNDHIQQYRRELQFQIDDESGRTVVKVMNVENGEVIRQMPSEQVLAMSHQLSEITGTMFQEKA